MILSNPHRVIFIAGPYRAKTEYELEEHIQEAEDAAIRLWQQGRIVICPHKNSAHFGGCCPDEVWLEGDLELLRRSDAVFMLPNWQQSEGARNEHAETIRLNKEVIYG